MRLCVDLNSLPENIGLPDALFGPDDSLELPEPELPLEDDVPPPEPDEPDDPEEDDDDPVVVRGTAWPASAGTAKPTVTRNVSVRIDMVMACSLGWDLPDLLVAWLAVVQVYGQPRRV